MNRTGKKITFKLTVEAQEMVVDYKPHWMKDLGLFEFRSPCKPARRIPVSETGYRSHFADMAEIEAAASPKEYARLAVLAILHGKSQAAAKVDDDQLALF